MFVLRGLSTSRRQTLIASIRGSMPEILIDRQLTDSPGTIALGGCGTVPEGVL